MFHSSKSKCQLLFLFFLIITNSASSGWKSLYSEATSFNRGQLPSKASSGDLKELHFYLFLILLTTASCLSSFSRSKSFVKHRRERGLSLSLRWHRSGHNMFFRLKHILWSFDSESYLKFFVKAEGFMRISVTTSDKRKHIRLHCRHKPHGINYSDSRGCERRRTLFIAIFAR